MKKRLFTFGCSFTRYYWPTWAEMLGREYDEFENWGQSGIGNRAILERLTECVVNNDITEDDTIIIQWSEIHRFDLHLPRPHLPFGWGQTGNILLSGGPYKGWVAEHWNEKSYLMHTLNFIKLAQSLLDSLPCRWLMFSHGDIKQDVVMHTEFINYLCLFDHPNFIDHMESFFSQYEFPKIELYNRDLKKLEVDKHPVPIAHFAWLNEKISPKLNVYADEKWAERCNETLFGHCKNFESIDDIFKSHMEWSRNDRFVLGVIDSDYSSKKLRDS
jgi:hypothetical protein